MTALRTLAPTCEFKERGTDFTKQMIRDRIICGIQNETLRRQLLTKKDVSLDNCVADCRTAEATLAQAHNMRSQIDHDPSDSVFVTDKRRGSLRTRDWQAQTTQMVRDCRFCGRDHQIGMRNCLAYGKRCNRCGRENHFASKCRACHGREQVDIFGPEARYTRWNRKRL